MSETRAEYFEVHADVYDYEDMFRHREVIYRYDTLVEAQDLKAQIMEEWSDSASVSHLLDEKSMINGYFFKGNPPRIYRVTRVEGE